MRLKVLGSGSSGNGYLLTSTQGDTLVIEAGVHAWQVFREVDYGNISGLIITHSHGDHARFLREYLDRRIATYIHEDTYHSIKGYENYSGFLPLFFEEEHPFKLGHYEILPFRLNHDVTCFGFLIRHPDMLGNLLFCTDTATIPYTFEDVQTLMIEADYDEDMLSRNEETGKIHSTLARRIRSSHYSISQAISFCRDRDDKRLRNIILIHLSKNNSSAEDFQSAVVRATGKPVYIAVSGLEVEVGNNPF